MPQGFISLPDGIKCAHAKVMTVLLNDELVVHGKLGRNELVGVDCCQVFFDKLLSLHVGVG